MFALREESSRCHFGGEDEAERPIGFGALALEQVQIPRTGGLKSSCVL